MKRLLYLLILFAWNISFSQSGTRYIDNLFHIDPKSTDYVYAQAPILKYPYESEMSTNEGDLIFRLFQPIDDTLQKRPMLVCFHSGGFVSGDMENDDMIEFCKIFARKGYVTATVSYRLGMNFFSTASSERAVYRAIQDSRACLRYIREIAEEIRVSPEHIYLLGSSAGAFIVLHNLFLDKESERPVTTYEITNSSIQTDNGPDLGSLDAIGSYFNQNSKANGIISLWGAIGDTAYIEAEDPQIPVFLVHGTADQSVPFGYGHPFGLATLPLTYGSELIDMHLNNLNYPHQSYFVPYKDHEFYGVSNGMWSPGPNQYWDTIVTKVREFLFEIHRPTPDFTYSQDNGTVKFINNSNKSQKWFWDFGDGQTSTEKDPTHHYNQLGEYVVTLTAYSDVMSEASKSSNIIITTIGVEDLPKLESDIVLYQNYPNPFKNITSIKYYLSNSSNISLKIYDLLGNEVYSLLKGFQEAGYHTIEFNSQDIGEGIYFYELRTNNSFEIKKMMIIK